MNVRLHLVRSDDEKSWKKTFHLVLVIFTDNSRVSGIATDGCNGNGAFQCVHCTKNDTEK